LNIIYQIKPTTSLLLFPIKIYPISIVAFITIFVFNCTKGVGQIDSIVNYKLIVSDTLIKRDSLKPLFRVTESIIKTDTAVNPSREEEQKISNNDTTQTQKGKKDYFEDETFLFGLSNYFFPIFRGPGFLYSTNDKWFSPGLNLVHCFTTDIKLQERVVFCSSLQLMFSGIAYKKTDLVEYGNGRSYDYPNSARYNGNMSNPMKFVTFNISAGAKVFQKNSKWPEGRYSKLEFVLFLEEVKYKSTKFVNYAEQPVAVGSGDYFYKNFAIAYTLGKQEVLFKKFILDYGIRVGFTPMVIPNYFYNSLLVSNMEMRLRVDSNYRLFREQLLNVHLGLSFLSF
jgi:hypothetical protein